VATRAEFSDLIWELQGELGTSHAYEMGGDHRKPPAAGPGPAGGRPARTAGAGFEIARIVEGDAWDARRGLATEPQPASMARSASASSRSTASRCRAELPPQAAAVHQAGTARSR
jgi:tricorn protease